MQRIIFIHGFGESERIFDKIAPSIGGNQIFVNVWELLGNEPIEGLNVVNFSEKLITHFKITAQDVVIGHSMGGWIAHHIKHQIGCRIVQIATWTAFDRVISPIRNGKILYWLVRYGLYINRFQRWLFVRMYKGKPSQQIFSDIFTDLVNAPKTAIINQLKLIFEPVPNIYSQPDLRIHALKDTVIKYPREPFHEVPGDHFTLVTHPQTVIEPIVAFLK